MILAVTQGAQKLNSWAPLWTLEGLFLAVVVALAVKGRSAGVLRAVPEGFRRFTGVPGWAGCSAALAWFGLQVAGAGFYSDVAWHVAYGRDKQLFTAPHTMIIVGLVTIAAAAVVGVLFATLEQARVGFRLGRVVVPWSMLPLGAVGFAAVTGFPLDDLWHAHYGIDVTMWSPTHLLMIVGASLSALAAWVALGEAGVRPTDGRWPRALHVIGAAMTLLGLTSVQGEFAFGVPQFQQLYHPVLALFAAGIALTAARIVLGRWWMLGTVVVIAAMQGWHPLGGVDKQVIQTRAGSLYIGCAIAVELAGLLVGTERRLRFALVSGFGIATIGLAGEWLWNAHALQPWRSPLLLPALFVGGIMALGASLVGTGLGGSIAGDRVRVVPATALAIAGVAVLFGMVAPFPRTTGHVTAKIAVEHRGDAVAVRATLSPVNAADHARWFQLAAWQGGKLVVANMKKVGTGEWASEKAVPIVGRSKAMLRLHRGDEMETVPIRFPADPEIHRNALEPIDKVSAFQPEQRWLLREQHGGAIWFAVAVMIYLALVVAVWVTTFAVAAVKTLSDGPVPVDPKGANSRRAPELTAA